MGRQLLLKGSSPGRFCFDVTAQNGTLMHCPMARPTCGREGADLFVLEVLTHVDIMLINVGSYDIHMNIMMDNMIIEL